MNKITKKTTLNTHMDVLPDEIAKELLDTIAFMQDEHNDPEGFNPDIDRTEYIISITIEERK